MFRFGKRNVWEDRETMWIGDQLERYEYPEGKPVQGGKAMITVLFFAGLREEIGLDQLQIDEKRYNGCSS